MIDWDIPLVEAHNQSFRDRYGKLFKQVLPEKLSKTFWLIHFTPRAYDAYHIMIRHIGSSLVHSMRGIVRARKHVVYVIIYIPIVSQPIFNWLCYFYYNMFRYNEA